MTEIGQICFRTLDVGCGTNAKGDVNIDFFRGGRNPQTGDQVRGEMMILRNIRNFILADAEHLPFKNESFEIAFSSHTIEHVKEPFLMLREMCRVAKLKVVVRFPHRKGSDAVRPFHVNFLDEDWFRRAAEIIGWESEDFVVSRDYLISSKLRKIFSAKWQKNLGWRALQHFERMKFMERFRPPLEAEVRLTKNSPVDKTY